MPAAFAAGIVVFLLLRGLFSGSFKTTSELVNTSAGINKLLLTGKERMALGADVYTDVTALGGTGNKRFSASADNLGFLIIRMDCLFHYTNST